MDRESHIMHLRHVLSARQFDRYMLGWLCALTDHIRVIGGTKQGMLWLKELFPHQRAMLYFAQPSTRTRLSFEAACQNLGMDVVVVSDPSTSSEVKGETRLDAIRTFSSYVNAIVMRTPDAGLAAEAAALLDQTPRPVPIINAGSGPDEHPTQALLDIYTLERSFRELGGIDGKTLALVGDLKRGRTVRSLAYLMEHYQGMRLILVSPPEFKMKEDVLGFLREHGIPFEETEDFDQAVAEADAVYMTRIQDEHDHAGESRAVDISRFCFTPHHLKILKPFGVVMHPLPRRNELDAACDADARVKIWRQERNGMWVRTALLFRVLRGQEQMKALHVLTPQMEEALWMPPDSPLV